MKFWISYMLLLTFASLQLNAAPADSAKWFPANHPAIQYTGRIDFTNPVIPRFWQPGVYITFRFRGTSCKIAIRDEMLWGSFHNYVELIVNGTATRFATKSKSDTLIVGNNLSAREHTVTLCKNTEANIGYLEFVAIQCDALLSAPPLPTRRIEFIGNSITCGAGSDTSLVPCGKGQWHDQHNAWNSYGAISARSLDARCHLSSVSGIGLMKSCCNMDIIMPQVFDKVSMRDDSIIWDFNRYQPDVVTVCLGQNDGIQDSVIFSSSYITFIKTLRQHYPSATIVLLSSPMANEPLTKFHKNILSAIAKTLKKAGDKNIATYFFTRSYNSGCDSHPDMREHALIAGELTGALKKIMNW